MPYLDTITEKRRQKSEMIQAEYTAAKLAAVLKEHLKSIKPESNPRLLKALESLRAKDDGRTLSLLEEIRDAMAKEKPPTVVPAPTVKVKETTVDTSRVEKLLEEVIDRLSTPSIVPTTEKTPDKPEPLTHYTAQDLDDAPDGTQYIGFMSISGNWYIMHHDTKTDRNTYYFGKGDYQEEWGSKYSHEYKPLSEAK